MEFFQTITFQILDILPFVWLLCIQCSLLHENYLNMDTCVIVCSAILSRMLSDPIQSANVCKKRNHRAAAADVDEKNKNIVYILIAGRGEKNNNIFFFACTDIIIFGRFDECAETDWMLFMIFRLMNQLRSFDPWPIQNLFFRF